MLIYLTNDCLRAERLNGAFMSGPRTLSKIISGTWRSGGNESRFLSSPKCDWECCRLLLRLARSLTAPSLMWLLVEEMGLILWWLKLYKFFFGVSALSEAVDASEALSPSETTARFRDNSWMVRVPWERNRSELLFKIFRVIQYGKKLREE